jgi:uncharacterized protein YcbX
MLTVARLSIAPVKSTRLHHPEEISLERFGAAGNRAFYLARPDGRLFTNKHHGPLVRLRADYDRAEERLGLGFPGGEVIDGDAARTAGAITTDFFGRAVQGHVLDGPWSEALSEYAGTPLVLVRPDRQGDGNDGYPVSLFSTASAEELARRSGHPEALDSRRFRMLIEVAGPGPHQEDGWIGRSVRVGAARVLVRMRVGRCVITTQSPETGEKDFDSLRALEAYRAARLPGTQIDFGVYASVVEPGPVRVGDPVEVEEDLAGSN